MLRELYSRTGNGQNPVQFGTDTAPVAVVGCHEIDRVLKKGFFIVGGPSNRFIGAP